jgi:KUP system potassium uptake protein
LVFDVRPHSDGFALWEKNMEAAFGLSVTLTMLITRFLMALYLVTRRINSALVVLITAVFLAVECSFLAANLQKLHEGGWIMLVVGAVLSLTMLTWQQGRRMQEKLIAFSPDRRTDV